MALFIFGSLYLQVRGLLHCKVTLFQINYIHFWNVLDLHTHSGPNGFDFQYGIWFGIMEKFIKVNLMYACID